MTILINLFGQPSAGKSTTSADLFASMKYMSLDAELCQEWVKKWAWEGTKITKYSQYYITGKEIHQQSRLFNKVDYIISDSPVFLGAFYNLYFNGNDNFYSIVEDFYSMAKEDGVEIYNFLLKRNKKYNPKGRYQTEEESDAVGLALESWLDSHDVPYDYLDCKDSERVDRILEVIGLTNKV